ncbi:hypothetical protein Tco_0880401, partial [Tanacetum coccineum]
QCLTHDLEAGATMTREVVNELIHGQVAEALEARDAVRNLEPLVEGEDAQEDENGDDYERGNRNGNGNGGVNRNGNGGGNDNGNKIKNKTRSNEAIARAYATRGGGTNPDSNVVMGTFLLNNCYASMLFDLGADRSFVLSTFSVLPDVAPSTLDTSYAVELADRRISETNVVLRGCTLGLLGYPLDIDLMPVKLGSFDVIIGDDCDSGSKSKLSIISCTKTQKYIQKGCQVYLVQVTSKKSEDKSEEKRLEDVPII